MFTEIIKVILFQVFVAVVLLYLSLFVLMAGGAIAIGIMSFLTGFDMVYPALVLRRFLTEKKLGDLGKNAFLMASFGISTFILLAFLLVNLFAIPAATVGEMLRVLAMLPAPKFQE
ncbi:MAG: hypothetical protein AAFX40_16150 [Cyanobacteria bacterium J06639_1]